MAMNCLDDSLLQMMVEGTLEGSELNLAHAHLRDCSICRKKVADYKQIMWDLQHPHALMDPSEIPSLDAMRQTLMVAWHRQLKEQENAQRSSRSLVPSWVGHSVMWARYVAPTGLMSGVIARTSSRVLDSVLTIRRKGKEGSRR